MANPDGNATVALQIACDAPGLPSRSDVERWVDIALAKSGREVSRESELCVRIVGEREMRDLNKRYRGMDRPTNVLAFPADIDELPGLPPSRNRPLGDLIICAPVVSREAALQGKEAAAHWAHMLVHGLLHLLGYDHDDEEEAERMESLEISILSAGGLENPYEDREPS